MNVDYNLIGSRIRQARQEKNYLQKDLAHKMDVSIGYISQLERGITKISLDTLGAIAEVLGKDICYFISESNLSASNYLFSEIDSEFSKLSPQDKQLTSNFIQLLLNQK